jgi:hypothetical protein
VYERVLGSGGSRLTRSEFDSISRINHHSVYHLRAGTTFALPGMQSHALSILVSGKLGVFRRMTGAGAGGTSTGIVSSAGLGLDLSATGGHAVDLNTGSWDHAEQELGVIEPFEFIDSPEYFVRHPFMMSVMHSAATPPLATAASSNPPQNAVFQVTLRALSDCT